MTAWMIRLVLITVVSLLAAGPAAAVRVDDVYADLVPLAAGAAEPDAAAYAQALRRVLVKATGKAATAQDATLLRSLGDPKALVQQYRRESNALWVQFDPVAVRRALDAAGQPVWSEDRPLTIVWLAWDDGAGGRDVLSQAAQGPLADKLRPPLLAAGKARALPLALPLRDAPESAVLGFSQVWGEATDAVRRASARYQAEAILLGRARLAPDGAADVRWTLLTGGERMDWRGGLADGPTGMAERLSQRLVPARGTESNQNLRLAVGGIRDMGQYGLVLNYLQAMAQVESLSVAALTGDAVVFELRLRGTVEQMAQALAVRPLLVPVAATTAGATPPDAGEAPLRYRLTGSL